MTSIAHSAAPAAWARSAALDRSRTFITMLVLIHHSVIAYTYYGHIDPQSFLGFDAMVVLNDSFFMSAMFFLSGLFVWPSLQRKGAGCFLRDRWWRLGPPFIAAAVILMPAAYYAHELRLQHDISFAAFWWKTVSVGPWPSGPAWFVVVLLALNVVAAAVHRAAPGCIEAISRLSLASFGRPALFFWALLIASIIAYIPAVLYFDASCWFTAGPIAIQVSRILLYLLYFLAGVGVGAVPLDRGLLANDGALARRWPRWLAACVAAFGFILALDYVSCNLLPDVDRPPLWWSAAYGLAFVTYSAAQTFNILALFLRFASGRANILDPLREDAYGIYLIHYIPVLWLQYALFNLSLAPVMQLSAVLKAVVVFILTLASSWAATAALRKFPAIAGQRDVRIHAEARVRAPIPRFVQWARPKARA